MIVQLSINYKRMYERKLTKEVFAKSAKVKIKIIKKIVNRLIEL